MAIPTGFTFLSGSPTDLPARQGVAINSGLTRFWPTDKVPGAGAASMAIFEFDAAYNEVATSGTLGVADGLPADTGQLNGIVLWDELLYCGYNNYPTEPAGGGIIVVDPADLTTVLAVHPCTNGHVEGCAIRETLRGPEAFVYTNGGVTIERYDLATWTLQGTHDFGDWAVGSVDAQYQGGGWLDDALLLGLHVNQSRPDTIDGCIWDDEALEFTPLARFERPTFYCGQGFNFSADHTLAAFAERNTVANPDEYRIVLASVASVAALPYGTPNGASTQRADLQYWYQCLAWDSVAPEWQLPDLMENATAATGFDGTRVYPTLAADGTRKIRFDGVDGSGIALGDLFGATGWTTATIWMRGVVVHSDSSADQILSWDAAGSNTGDGRVELNRLTPRTVTLWYNNDANALTTDAAVFDLGVPFDLFISLGPAGSAIYVNGVLKKASAVTGRIGGANQACYLGSNRLLASGAEFDVWDVRLYDEVKDPLVLATYDMWSDPIMGTLSAYTCNGTMNLVLGVAAFAPAATHYLAAFVAGTEVTGGSYARKAVTNNTTNWPNSVSRVKSLGVKQTFVTAAGADWGIVDEVRIYDASTGGNELASDPLASPVTVDDGDTLEVDVGDLTITAQAGALSDDLAEALLDHVFGSVDYTPEATVQFAYYAGNPQGAGAEITGTSYARITKNNTAVTWAAAASGGSRSLIDFAFPTAGAGGWNMATYWALFDAAGTGLMFSAVLPATRTVAAGVTETIQAGRIRPSFI